MIKIVIAGFKGRMGTDAVKMVCEHENFSLVGCYDPHFEGTNISELAQFSQLSVPVFQDKLMMIQEVKPDIWIDFTIPDVAYEHTLFAIKKGISPVVGTTGITNEQVAMLKKLSQENQVGGLIAPNFTIGAVLMMQFAAQAAKYFPDVEIIELHHDQKLDAPSGTAIKTAEMISKVRAPKIQGNPSEKEILPGARGADYEGMRIHSVRLPGLIAHQQVQFGGVGEGLTIRHDSYDRQSFMTGVALACEKVTTLNQLVYGLEEIL